MFISQFSGKQYPAGVTPVRVVVARRNRTYTNVVNHTTIVSQGWEIVKEMLVGPDEVEHVKGKTE